MTINNKSERNYRFACYGGEKGNHISIYSPASVKSKLSTPIYVHEFEGDTSDLKKIPIYYTLFLLKPF